MGSLNQATLTASLEAEVAQLATLDPTTLADEQIRDGLRGLLRIGNQVAAVTAGFVGSFDTRGLSEADGLRATRTWLLGFGHMSQGAATGWLKRARLLREMPALDEAAKNGAVSSEHLAKVTDLEAKVGLAPIKEYDTILAELASAATPVEVAKSCERIRAYIDPDGPPPDPEAAFQRRGVDIVPCGSVFVIRGQLDPEGAAALKTVLDALMKPPGPDDLRTASQRRADALIELARLHLTAGDLPTVGGVRPHIGILIRPQTLANVHYSNGHADAHGSADAAANGRGNNHADANRHCNGHADADADARGSASANRNSGGDGDGEAHGDARASGRDNDDRERARNDHAEGDDSDGQGPEHRDMTGNDGRRPPPRPRTSDPLSSLGVPPLPDLPWMNWVGEIPPELAQRIACDCEMSRLPLLQYRAWHPGRHGRSSRQSRTTSASGASTGSSTS